MSPLLTISAFCDAFVRRVFSRPSASLVLAGALTLCVAAPVRALDLNVDQSQGNSPYLISSGNFTYNSVVCGFDVSGLINHSNGTVNATTLYVAYGATSTGTYHLGNVDLTASPNAVLTATTEYVGYGGDATFTLVRGGTNTISGGLFVGFALGHTGQYTLYDQGTLSAATLQIGDIDQGIFTQNGGTNTISGTVTLGIQAGSGYTGKGSYLLNGGVLQTAGVAKGAGTATFLLNGGLLRAGADSTTFMQGLTSALVGGGGAQFDTNGHNITIAQTLLHDPAAPSPTDDGGVTKLGSGTLTLTGNNSAGFYGAVNLDAGVLSVGGDQNLGRTTGALNFNGGTLQVTGTTLASFNSHPVNTTTFNGGLDIAAVANNFSVPGGLSGSNLTKAGAGTLTLGGTNSFTGTTTVNAGTLMFGSGATFSSTALSLATGAVFDTANLPSGALTIGNGQSLGGLGTISAVTIGGGGNLAPGNSVGTITVGTLTLSSGSLSTYEFNGTFNDFTNVTNSNGLTINGGSFTLYDEGTTDAFDTVGSYDLIGYTGTLQGSVSFLSVANPAPGRIYKFSNTANRVVLTVSLPPDVSVAASPASVAEDGAPNLDFTFTRTGDITGPLTVNFSVGGTALHSTDYTDSGADSFGTTNGTVTFAANSATAVVTIDPTGDSGVEADETVMLTVTSGTGYTPGSPNSATGTIANDDTEATVAVSPTSVAEDSGNFLAFTFTRTGVTSGALTLHFTVGGTASSSDYTQMGTATFPANSATVTVTIHPWAENNVEADETVIFTVDPGPGYTVGSPNSATGTIVNDDTDVTVAVSPTSVAENGATNLVYTFTRNGVTSFAQTVNFTVGGTANSSNDYTQTGAASFTPPNGTVTFAAGSSTAAVTIQPTGDSTPEPNETVSLTVAAGTSYNVGTPASATGTIVNDDTDVSVTVSPASVAEDGATNLDYTFTRNGVTSGTLTVNFTVGGTAEYGTDYGVTGETTFTTTSGSITFAAGSSTAELIVDPTADSTFENNETVTLTITSGAGYNVGSPASATGTIDNDDVVPAFTINDVTMNEGNTGTTTFKFTVTKNGTSALLSSVTYETMDGTATAPSDYTAIPPIPPMVLTFAPGESSKDIDVLVNGDTTAEPNETFTVHLSAPAGATITDPDGLGTITNDDTEVSVAVSPSSVAENSGTDLVYTFTRTGVTTGALTVNFTVGGTATFNTDYTQTGAASFTPPDGTVTFAAGSPTTTVTIHPAADTTVEPDETISLTLASGTGYNVASPGSATATIVNDDTDVSVAVSPSSVDENSGTDLVYTFTRTGVTTGALTVNFTVGGTATFNTDYTQTGAASFTPPDGTVTIAAGSPTAVVTIHPAADSTIEPNETVVLTVTSGTGYNVGSPSSGTGTIVNDDTDVSVAVSPSSVDENSGSDLVYTFTRTGVTAGALTANFTVGGTATFNTDYTQTGAASFTPPDGTVAFAAGSPTATVTIHPTADSTVEPDETVVLTVTSGTGYNAGSPSSATGTISNDDTDVSVAVSPSSVAENSGTDLVYTFTRNGVTTGALTVNFTVGGTATFNTDYTQTGAASFTPPNGTVTFAGGIPTATVTIHPTADSTVEPDETASLTLASGTGYTVVSPDSAIGTIVNDDTDVSVTVSPPSVAEDGGTNLVYTFTRNPQTSGPITVNFSVGGAATFNTDYTQSGAATFGATSGSVVIPAGDTTAMVTIDPSADTTVEPDETLVLTITAGTSYNIGSPSAATGTITTDDTDVTVAVSPASVVEDGVPNLVYSFTRTGVTTGSITVNFSVSGTASFPSDYSQSGAASFTSSSGSVTMGNGITLATVTIDPATDTIYESNELATLTVTSGTGYNPGTPVAATGTIANDDDAPPLAIGDKIASEGTTGGPTTNFAFTVTRTGNTEVAATVNFATSDGTTNPATGGGSCTTGVDYITQNGLLTFPASAGPNSQTITILVCKDATVESNETFFIDLSGATDATIGDGQGRGTIQNDDSPGTSLTVNTTDDVSDGICDAHCTLREAITALNGSVSPDAVGISFAIPSGDPRHFYYSNDGVAGQVTNDGSHVFPTSAVDDTTIAGIDPDWPHSWWSILPTSSLPPITHRVVVDGFTQTGAIANTLTTGDNAVLRIELNGASAGGSASGLTLTASTSNLRGLVINRFSSHGLDLQGGTSNSVVANFIGTDVSGTLDLGNTVNGISTAGNSLTIGGSTPSDINLISGNNGDGIAFSNSNSDLVLGNLIGTKANGTAALGNGGNGISFTGAGSGFNTIGGTQSTDGNTIANNGGDGVQVASTASIGNAIRGNSIFSNGTTSQHLGIDLATDGVTANDAKDPDTGANNQQNFPIITSALVTGSTRTIKGTLNSKVGETFDIDFYASTSCDASGNGEGQTYLGSITSDPTDANGDVSFTFHPDASHEAGMTIGKRITATATSTGASFSTSELSACFTAADGSSGAGDIQFTSATYSGGEAAGPASITVTRVGGSNGSVTTNFSTSDGTAQAPGDYTAVTNFPVTYADGETGDKVVTVTPFNDTTYEGNETVNLALSGTQIVGAPPSPGPPHAAVLTIVEDDAVPGFTIDDVTLNEGNAGTTSFTFTVTKTGSTALSSTVDFTTQNGTATVADSDYAAKSGTLTFAASDTAKTITVLVTGDAINEATEAFTVHLSNPSGATISDADGTGTITNDDPQPTFTVASASVAENGVNATVTITKNGATAFTTAVHYATSNGSATAPADYAATSGDLTFAPGDSIMTFTVPIVNDTFFEGDETFGVTLSAPSNATLGTPSSATVTINENDPAPVLQFSSATYGVGEAGGTVTITVTKTGSTAVNATVHYATSDGTAAAPGDYASTAGDLTFAPGDTSMSFTVPINNDIIFEGNESFSVTLSAPVNATLGATNPATVTITDNDAAPTVQFSATNYNVNESAGTVTVTVTKTGATAFNATVHYATSDGTATAPGDYTSTSGDLTFAPGETSKDFTVSITNDNVFEATESFNVTLSSPGNATLGTPSSATVTITDNDAQPTVQFSQASYSAGEGAGNATLIVTKTGATALSATVHFATSDGTAKQPGDYTATSSDLTFASGETSKQIQVPIANDTLAESNEDFTVTLSAPSGATLGTPASTTVTIVDNDTLPQVQWTSATYTADENAGTAVLMVRRTGNDSGDMVVHYSTADGTAKAGSDYTATSGDLTFLAGGPPEQTVNVPLINDSTPESTENFTVTLSAPSGGTVGTPSTARVSITDTDTAPSPTPTPTATPGPTAAQALNLATRLKVETGDHAMIAGFIITGNGFKQVVLRGLGPSLAGFNIPDFLPDPVLELRRSNNSLIIRNNDWKDNQRGQIEGTPFEPKDDRESVIVATLQPGAYAAILTEKNDQTGVGLVEVYDTDPPSNVQLANISTRGFVRTDTKVMIGGFTLGGNSNSPRIVVRGLGPSLKKFFLTDLLADPTLELHNANGTPTIVNDNWQDDPVSAAQLIANNFAPEDPNEAAIFISLAPGPYTAILAGKGGSIGLGLVEIYNLQ